jgi:hypothetical protein
MLNNFEIDRIAYKFLKIMGVEINFTPDVLLLNKLPSFQNSVFNPDFPSRVATELTAKVFTQSKQKRISWLIEELRKENPSLIERAHAKTKQKVSGLGNITYKVFDQLSTAA